MPGTFALGAKVIGNAEMATFAAFGSFAMLLLADFGGPIRSRLQSQAGLALCGAIFVALGTLASRTAWLAALSMAVVAFAVLFAGVVSSVLASAGTSLLLAFILPVALAAPVAAIPDELAGWGIAGAAGLVAIAVLWPAPARAPFRNGVVGGCAALAERLRADVAYLRGDRSPSSKEELDTVAGRARTTIEQLRRTFYSSPNRPSSLTTEQRLIVRVADELFWLDDLLAKFAPHASNLPVHSGVCVVKERAAGVLDGAVALLQAPSAARSCELARQLQDEIEALHGALGEVERTVTIELPDRQAALAGAAPAAAAGGAAGAGTAGGAAGAGAAGDVPGSPIAANEQARELVSSLDPSFRAQELTFIVSQIAANAMLAAEAERRSFVERLTGHQPAGVTGPLSSARERASSHLEWHSVWLHNSLRGAIGLGLAVLVARLTGVQHAFWVVLGSLSVLRSNALSTGQNVLRSLAGTVIGFVVGAALLEGIGTDKTVLWFILPVAVVVAGIAPAAISFAAGQAAFTILLVILFNIIQPAGWRVGLLRVEDIAIGCGVSLVVGVLFWPRGAAATLAQALAEAYRESARYLAGAVRGAIGGSGSGSGRSIPAQSFPAQHAVAGDDQARAAAAARRLDDAFRGLLIERGSKPVPLAEVTALVSGVIGLRLAADAVVELWQRAGEGARRDGRSGGAVTELEATSDALRSWYERLAASLTAEGEVPVPLAGDGLADRRLVDSVRAELLGSDGKACATAIRLIWIGDHLDAARRLQGVLVDPARAVNAQEALAQRSTPWRYLVAWPWPARQQG
ncbi:MAG TPA: FUSC family protein [Acidimicrobiales bacterium]|nr:FUSC family protein [Acidimicrobiales bacterium]